MAGPDPAINPMTAEAQLFPWWLFLLWGLLTLLIGLMFLLTPGITMELFITFLGAYWLVGGLFMIASLFVDRMSMWMKILLAVINIIAGALILLYPLFSTFFVLAFLILFLGFWACFIGAVHLFHAFTTKDAGNGVLGIISIVFGILLIAHPIIVIAILPFIAGGFCVVSGLATLYVAFVGKKAAGTPAA
jgi:uncharacterized membrane protein HdeD (DUF308 family)